MIYFLKISTFSKLFSFGVIMIFESKRYAQGGVEGGTHIKIKGNSFDGYNEATKVMLGYITLITHDPTIGDSWRPALCYREDRKLGTNVFDFGSC